MEAANVRLASGWMTCLPTPHHNTARNCNIGWILMIRKSITARKASKQTNKKQKQTNKHKNKQTNIKTNKNKSKTTNKNSKLKKYTPCGFWWHKKSRVQLLTSWCN